MGRSSRKYTVMVDDNYHYQDDDYRRSMGMFDTHEEALAPESLRNELQVRLRDRTNSGAGGRNGKVSASGRG